MPPLTSSHLAPSFSHFNNSNISIQSTTMTSTTNSQQQQQQQQQHNHHHHHHHHHHHRTNLRSQTLLKLSNIIIPPSSSNLKINLVEPVLYFRGDTEESVGCFLRGDLILNLSKPTKIRKIEMKFVGRMKTFWPEGKLYYGSNANRNDLCEEQEIMTHNWTFVAPPTPSSPSLSPSPSSHRLRILRTCSSSNTLTTSKFHLIPAGIHKYPFELFIPGNIPETIEAERGTVNYKLSAVAIRSGLSPNLHVSQNVTIIRTVLEERNSEGIAIANDWNNQLGYEITIPKKAYPIGDSIDIDLKLNPRGKNIKVTGVKIFIDQKSIYKTKGQKNLDSRTLSVYKIDSFSEQNIRFGKNNDTTNTIQEGNSSSTYAHEHVDDSDNIFYHENISFPIPKCTSPIHYSYKSSSINISHYLRIVLTVKIPGNNEDDKKRKKVEMKVDVPITMLSCSCADDLPQYEDENYNYHDSSPSYESPPSYEQSTNDRRRSHTITGVIPTIPTITTDLHPPPLERLLTF